MHPLVPLGVVTIGILALIFRKRPSSLTAWTAEGLPAPDADLAELYTLAQGLVSDRANHGVFDPGALRLFKRRAGLSTISAAELRRATAEFGPIAEATAEYDARTRQAVGFYGRLWKEQAP
jgi:hypothetical protein